MRIGLLTSIGGTADAFFPEMVQRWRDSGNSIFPAAGSPSTLAGSEIVRGVTRRPGVENVRAVPGLRRWARERRLDVIISNTATASALVRLAKPECAVVYFCHGLHWVRPSGFRTLPWRAAERGLLGRTDGVITLNSDDEAWFRNVAEGMPSIRLPAGVGVDLDQFPRSPLPSSGTPRIAWIGEFSRRKRPQLAIEAARLLHARGLDFSLVMMGRGPMLEGLKDWVEELGLGEYVRFLGRVDDVVPHLLQAKVVAHTASWEGLPRALLEGAAVGRPLVGFDVKGVRDVPGVFLAGDGDVQQFASLLASAVGSGLSDWSPVVAREISYESSADRILSFLELVNLSKNA